MSFSSSVLELEKVNKEELNFFLLSEHHTLLYTSLPYFNLLKSFLNADIKIIVIRKKEKLVGYMPLAFKTDIQYGCVCNSLPFYGSNGGMVVSSMEDKDSIRTMLLNEYNDQVERKKCIASTVITNPLDKEGDSWLRENLIHDLVDERIGQITHFPITSEENIEQQLLSVFEDPRPRNIRKAQKDGVKIYTSNTKEALDFLYQIHHDNITAINGVSKKKLFFDMLHKYQQFLNYAITL